jgi:hypothetical protein
MSDIAMRQPNALWCWWHWRWPGEQCHHEVAEHNTMLVARALADEQRCHEAAKRTAALAELALAGEQCNCQQQQQQ